MQIIQQNITQTLEKNYMPYAMSVIVSRAIPEIDGFKPAHRKLLYTMYKMGLLNGPRVKSADVVGQTMALNPHGDGAIYETLVRLTRGNEALLHPFIDSKGNFGKQHSRDMAYAASRYTEVRLDAICNLFFKDIDKDTVDFVANYNGSTTEPLLLPASYPNLLVTPNQGIAVGMASAICSFNLREVCETTIAYIKDRNFPVARYLKGPDFSTGGQLLYNDKEIQTIYETGRGSFKLRARYRFDQKNNCIEVYEIPYTTTIEFIIDKIVALVRANKVKEISDVRDETDLNGLKIAIDIKRGTNPDLLMHKLYTMTPLSDTYSCNFNILIESRPRVMGIREILGEWLSFRVKCIRRGLHFDIAKKSEKLHLLEGLAQILLDIDKAVSVIRHTEAESKVIPNLMDGFGIDKAQAEYIADIKLRNLNKEYLLNRISERDTLAQDIAGLTELAQSDEKIESLICKELKEISKKHGKDRKTEVLHETYIPEIPQDVLIEDYAVKLFLTEHNYFKKIPLTSLRSAGEQYLKDNDTIVAELETSNRADVLFFTNKANLYKAKAHELPDCKASAIGEYLSNTLALEEDESITLMAATTNYQGYLIFAFENGKAAKILLESYALGRKKTTNAYSNKSPLASAHFIEEDTNFIATRDDGREISFNTSILQAKKSRTSVGAQIIKLRKNKTSKMVSTRPQ